MLENHLVIGDTDKDLDAFYGIGLDKECIIYKRECICCGKCEPKMEEGQ